MTRKMIDSDSCGEVEDEGMGMDFESLQGFLNADFKKIDYKPRKKLKRDEDVVCVYETVGRKWGEPEADKLLVKNIHGKWISPSPEVESFEEACDYLDDNEDEKEPEAPTLSLEQWAKELAQISEALCENIQENFGKLKKLPQFYKCGDSKKQMLALASTVAIYKDIIPSYNIRSLTEAEKEAKVSKEVKNLREFEQSLLSSYSEFVSFCKQLFSKKSNEYAFKSLCELCKASSSRNFNHFESILATVSSAASGHRSLKIRIAACKALKSVFEDSHDSDGRFTMLALKAISSCLRAKNYNILDKELFEVLECVKLRHIDSISVKLDLPTQQTDSKKTQSHLSKRNRKLAKEEKKEARKKAIIDAQVTQKQHQKWAKEIREHLFAILFGFLKSPEKNVSLLSSCMSAISKFCEFLGIEYFSDLTNCIKKICKEYCDDVLLSLYCTCAVFTMSNRLEAASSLDLKFFYDQFYAALQDSKALLPHLTLAQKTFAHLFKSRKILPKERVASFAHRLAQAASNCEKVEGSLFYSECLLDLFTHYPSIKPLLQDEQVNNGTYLESCNDPDICRPFCRKLDLTALKQRPECSVIFRKLSGLLN